MPSQASLKDQLKDQLNRAAYLGDIRAVAKRHPGDPSFALPEGFDALSTKELGTLRNKFVKIESSL